MLAGWHLPCGSLKCLLLLPLYAFAQGQRERLLLLMFFHVMYILYNNTRSFQQRFHLSSFIGDRTRQREKVKFFTTLTPWKCRSTAQSSEFTWAPAWNMDGEHCICTGFKCWDGQEFSSESLDQMYAFFPFGHILCENPVRQFKKTQDWTESLTKGMPVSHLCSYFISVSQSVTFLIFLNRNFKRLFM